MNKIATTLSLASLLSLSLLAMQPASFNKFPELPQDIRQLIIIGSLDKDNILQSLYSLKLVNREFYNVFLNKDIRVRQNIFKTLANNLNVTTRAIALHIIKAFNLTRTRPQLAKQLLKDNPAHNKSTEELLTAILKQNIEKLKNFTKQKADVSTQDTSSYETIIETLLKSSADVNVQDDYGDTALIQAACWGHYAIVELLLKHSADANIQDNDGCSPLMLAASAGQKNIVELLIRSGAADITIKDNLGSSASDHAKSAKQHTIAKMLKPKTKQQSHCLTK